MTSSRDGHLSDKQLLLYVDGELASRETARVRTHLQACWTCRARLGDLEIAIKDLIAFRSQVLLPIVPTPPDPWAGMENRFEELDKVVPRRSFVEQLTGFLRFTVLPPRRLVFGLLMVLAVLALICLPSQRAITASELLARVRAAQTAEFRKVHAPVLHQRLRVRRDVTGSGERSTSDYDSWEDQSRGRFRQTGSSAAVLAELRAICTTNQLDWQSPLSAAAYSRWRDSLPVKQDTVAPAKVATGAGAAAGGEGLALTTSASSQITDQTSTGDPDSNRLIRAELVVRTTDWHPVAERLWVNGREYEIAELDYKVLPLSEVDAVVFADQAEAEPVRAPQPRLSEVAVSPAPRLPDPDETEMAVRYGLHQLDADLGEPVEIRRIAGGEILVDASEVSPQLRATLKEKFSALPNTQLEFEKAASCETCLAPSPTGAEETSSPPLTVLPTVNSNEKRLEEIFGEPSAQESFTRDVITLSGDALSHCFALRNLALRYPPQAEAGLTPVARNELHEMVEDHFAVLAEGLSHLQGLLRPLLEALSGSGAADAEPERGSEVREGTARSGMPDGRGAGDPSGDSGPSWQSRSFQILATMQKADLLVRSLLTSTNNPLPADQIIPPLRQALSEQQKTLKQYKELY